MEKNQKKQRQHYIPRFILKNWQNNTDKIFIVKKTKFMNKKIADAFQEVNLYEINNTSYEKRLSEIEGKAAPIIKKIIDSIDNISLTRLELLYLKHFLTISALRDNNYIKSEITSLIDQKIYENLLNYNFESNDDVFLDPRFKELFDRYFQIIELSEEIPFSHFSMGFHDLVDFSEENSPSHLFFQISPKILISLTHTKYKIDRIHEIDKHDNVIGWLLENEKYKRELILNKNNFIKNKYVKNAYKFTEFGLFRDYEANKREDLFTYKKIKLDKEFSNYLVVHFFYFCYINNKKNMDFEICHTSNKIYKRQLETTRLLIKEANKHEEELRKNIDLKSIDWFEYMLYKFSDKDFEKYLDELTKYN